MKICGKYKVGFCMDAGTCQSTPISPKFISGQKYTTRVFSFSFMRTHFWQGVVPFAKSLILSNSSNPNSRSTSLFIILFSIAPSLFAVETEFDTPAELAHADISEAVESPLQ